MQNPYEGITLAFMPKRKVEELVPPGGSHLISISDGDHDKADVNEDHWETCKFFFFVDDEYDEEKIALMGQDFMDLHRSYISIEQAEEIRLHIFKILETNPSTIIVNCRAGKSRSAAIAKYISEITGAKLEGDTSGLNNTVLRLLRQDGALIAALRNIKPIETEEKQSFFEKLLGLFK